MRVTMVTEGTYPFHTGGVSTWCDQVVRGLPEHRFDVVAISADLGARPTRPLPSNVDRVILQPMWTAEHSVPRVRQGLRREFEAAMANVLRAVIEECDDPVDRLEGGLRQLLAAASRNGLLQLTVSARTTEQLVELWARAEARGRLAWSGAPMLSLSAAVRIVDHVVQALRVLGADPPAADVVHAVANGHCGLLGLGIRWRRGTPLVVSEHGVFLRERILAYRSDEASTATRAVMVRFHTLLSSLVYRRADQIVPVSQFNARWAIAHGAAPSKVSVIHNGIDVGAFPVAPPNPGGATLTWVGRVDPLKDVGTLIRAFAQITNRRPDTLLQIYGPVPESNLDYFAQCRRLVEELRLSDRVTFMGPVSPTWPAYHAGNAVLLSSISEGMPYTVLEAMATGRATISTAVGGVGEAVGDAGLLVPPRDPEAMARAALALLDDRQLQRDLGSRAHARVSSLFRLDRSVANYGNLYAAITSEAGPAVVGRAVA
jgi:glycosyltransferase involved in cell wall biosynthesis